MRIFQYSIIACIHAFLANVTVWVNVSKVAAITGTTLISYLGMRLWVFVSKRPKKHGVLYGAVSVPPITKSRWSTRPVRGADCVERKWQYNRG